MNLEQILFAIENGQPEEILNIAFLNKVKQAILDAEGDGGAVAWQYRYKNDRMQWSRWLDWEIEGREDQFPEKIGRWEVEYRRLYTHPARSGVVSDEDVFEHLSYIGFSKGLDGEYAPSTVARTRAALEHFAKGERHER